MAVEKTASPHRPKPNSVALNLGTVTSKTEVECIAEAVCIRWDDSRMPTIAGMRRRGYRFSGERIGVTRKLNTIELQILESSIRDDLNESKKRWLF